MKNGQRKLGLYPYKRRYSLAISMMVLMCASFFMSAPDASALTTVPTKTNFQGRLTNSAGNIMPDGLYNMKFRLFTVDTGGAAVWTETRETTNRVQVTNGLFSVRLGDVTAIPASLFASGPLYFEIELPTPATATCSTAACGVFTEGPMTPRNQLATSAYAYNSETLDGLDSTQFARTDVSNTFTASQLFNLPLSGEFAVSDGTSDLLSISRDAGGNTDINLFFNDMLDIRNDTSDAILQMFDGTFSGYATNFVHFFTEGTFKVEGPSGDLFKINASTGAVSIGTANTTTSLLVLDTKSSSGDPTGIEGATYYNSNLGKFRCYQAGAWIDCAGINNSTTQQIGANFNIDGTGTATTLQAGTFDTASAVTLSIGSTNATSISIAKDTTVAAGKTVTIVGGATGTRPASPTEGMIYFDTTTKQLLTYANGKWQADRSTSTKIVAASNSSQAVKDAADFVADGIEDEIDINNALIAAAGGKVYLAEGTYVASGTILIPNNTTLTGAGRGSSIEFANLGGASDNLIENSDTTTGVGVVIQDLRLNGRNDINTTGWTEGVRLNGMGGGSGATFRKGATIRNILADSFLGYGIDLHASSHASITDNTIQGNESGLVLDDSSNTNMISNNTSQDNTQSGFVIWGGQNNIFTSNTALRNDSYGFESDDSDNTLTSNISQDNTQSGFVFYGGVSPSGGTLSGNTSTNNGGNGFEIYTSHTTVSDNTAKDNTGNGLALGATFITATGNIVRGNDGMGIDMGDDNITVTGNTIYLNGGRGISTTNSKGLISSNTITDNTQDGIGLYNGPYNTVTGNQIHNNGGANFYHGIDVGNSDNNTITNNVITDTAGTGYAIWLRNFGGPSDNNYLADNTYSGTGAATINDTGAGTVRAGQVDSSGNFAIQPAGTVELLKNTTVTGSLTVKTTNSSTDDRLTITAAPGGAAFYSGTITNADLTAARTWTLPDESGTFCMRSSTACGFAASSGSANYIQNQNGSQQSSSNFWISGVARADTSISTPLLDTATAVALNIGTTNATTINLNEDVTVAAGESLRIAGGATGTRPASPTEGMIYYDTDTKQLLTYANGKWQADRTESIIVAASNSSQSVKDAADYVADGTGDQTEINNALTAGAGSKVYLAEGTFTVNDYIYMPDDTILAGVGSGTVVQFANLAGVSKNMISSVGIRNMSVRDMKLDGRSDINASGTQVGIDMAGVGWTAGSEAGITIENVEITRFRTAGITVDSSSEYVAILNSTITANALGISVNTASNLRIVGNTILNNTGNGIQLTSGTKSTITNNTIVGNAKGVFLSASTNNVITSNTISTSTNEGIGFASSSNSNTVSSNSLVNNGGSTTNNAILLADSDSNTVTGNTVTDSSATTTNYALNVSNAASDANYLADNFLSTGSINDAGTGTIYSSQINASNQLMSRSTGGFAFQGSAGTNLFSSTGTGSLNIGTSDTTGTVLVLDTKTGSGDPTGVVGAMYYNSNAGKFRCYEGAAWVDCITVPSTSQTAYTASTGSTTPEIKLDSTRGGLDIQDADTTIASSLFAVRGSNGSGLGAALFDVTSTGIVTAQNNANSTAAFSINNAAAASLFVADTTNSRIQIGNATADATGVVLVLDTKNTAGDPTGVDGAMYYNSNSKSFRCYQDGAWRSCIGGLVASNTSVQSISNTTSADITKNYVIAANNCVPGRVYRISARGTYDTNMLTNPTLTMRVKLNSTIILSSAAAGTGTGVTNRQWIMSADIICQTIGTTGSVEAAGTFNVATSATNVATVEMLNSASTTVDTTVAQTLQLNVAWATAHANNVVDVRQVTIESLGP